MLPEIHRQAVEVYRWMNDATFVGLFAIAQAAPGPNVLLSSVIGWKVAGIAGAMVATTAMLVPSSLIAFGVGRGKRLIADRWFTAFGISVLVPVALGLMIASGITAARSNHAGLLGYTITAASALFVIATRRNPLIAMLAGAASYAVADLML